MSVAWVITRRMKQNQQNQNNQNQNPMGFVAPD